MTRLRLRRLSLVAAALCVVTIVASPASAEPEFGTITGTITDNGAPVVGARVTGQGVNFGFGQGITDDTGRYEMTVPADTYRVHIYSNGLTQYAFGQQNFENATLFDVAEGGSVVVNDSLVPHGRITGRFVDRAGQGLQVNVGTLTPNFEFGSFTNTDELGNYVLDVRPGEWLMMFTLSNNQIQFAFGKPEGTGTPDVFTVGVGESITVNDTLAPTGSLAGRVTEANGTPIEGATVAASTQFSSRVFATTDADGNYRFDQIFVGPYRVEYSTPDGRSQWAHNKFSFETADEFPITEDATTTVDEVFAATGSLRVQARDKATGAAIDTFCAQVGTVSSAPQVCTTDGTVLVPVLPVGPAEILVYTEGGPYASVVKYSVIRAGQESTVTASLELAGRIVTTIRDRKTGGTVADVCVQLHPAGVGLVGEGGWCTDELGRLEMFGLTPGKYQIFVRFPDERHGAQWVGPGQTGVGLQSKARVITVPPGGTATLPAILLDKPGTIAGRITNAVTGQPVPNVCAFVSPRPPVELFCSEQPAGRYEITGLGPYEWPIQFSSATGFSWEWYRGTANRLNATPVRVRVGQTTTLNSALLPGGATLRGRVVDRNGQPVSGGTITVHNMVTGDPAAQTATVGTDGRFAVTFIHQQSVRVIYQTPLRPPVSYQNGTVIQLNLNQTRTITFTVPF